MKKGLNALSQPLSIVAVAIIAMLGGCGSKEGGQAWSEAPPAVKVESVRSQPFAITSDLPGRVEPVRVAEVRARVAGIVLARKFVEGTDVKAGDVLFQIDSAPYEAALMKAKGELAKVEAAVFDAQAVVHRYEPLAKIEAVSKQDFEAAQTTLKSALAARTSAQADVQTARLNVEYAIVRAPISGRVGRAMVTEGALVGQGDATALATIQQLSPVYVDFKQPAPEALRMRESLRASGTQRAELSASADGMGAARKGHLLFSDITVDRTTGQVSLRGEFDNRDGALLPGMYVRVLAAQGNDPKAILVPQRAVQRTSDGKAQVLVIGKGDTAEIRPVKTGTTFGTQIHVTEGLKEGERLVVEGGGKARPGEKVTIEGAAQPAPKLAANVTNATATGSSGN